MSLAIIIIITIMFQTHFSLKVNCFLRSGRKRNAMWSLLTRSPRLPLPLRNSYGLEDGWMDLHHFLHQPTSRVCYRKAARLSFVRVRTSHILSFDLSVSLLSLRLAPAAGPGCCLHIPIDFFPTNLLPTRQPERPTGKK